MTVAPCDLTSITEDYADPFASHSGLSWINVTPMDQRSLRRHSNSTSSHKSEVSVINSALLWIGSASAAFALFLGESLAQVGVIPPGNAPYFHGHDMMWGGGQWGSFGMVLGPLLMILIVVAAVVGVFYLLRSTGTVGTSSGRSHDRALAILKERFAKGEMDTKEFDERRKLLAD